MTQSWPHTLHLSSFVAQIPPDPHRLHTNTSSMETAFDIAYIFWNLHPQAT